MVILESASVKNIKFVTVEWFRLTPKLFSATCSSHDIFVTSLASTNSLRITESSLSGIFSWNANSSISSSSISALENCENVENIRLAKCNLTSYRLHVDLAPPSVSCWLFAVLQCKRKFLLLFRCVSKSTKLQS